MATEPVNLETLRQNLTDLATEIEQIASQNNEIHELEQQPHLTQKTKSDIAQTKKDIKTKEKRLASSAKLIGNKLKTISKEDFFELRDDEAFGFLKAAFKTWEKDWLIENVSKTSDDIISFTNRINELRSDYELTCNFKDLQIEFIEKNGIPHITDIDEFNALRKLAFKDSFVKKIDTFECQFRIEQLAEKLVQDTGYSTPKQWKSSIEKGLQNIARKHHLKGLSDYRKIQILDTLVTDGTYEKMVQNIEAKRAKQSCFGSLNKSSIIADYAGMVYTVMLFNKITATRKKDNPTFYAERLLKLDKIPRSLLNEDCSPIDYVAPLADIIAEHYHNHRYGNDNFPNDVGTYFDLIKNNLNIIGKAFTAIIEDQDPKITPDFLYENKPIFDATLLTIIEQAYAQSLTVDETVVDHYSIPSQGKGEQDIPEFNVRAESTLSQAQLVSSVELSASL